MSYLSIEYGAPLSDLSGFTCISRNQLVGDGFFCALRRDLYENAAGDRISVAVTPWMELPTKATWENQVVNRTSVGKDKRA